MTPSPFDAMPVTRPEAIAADVFLIPNLAPGPDGLLPAGELDGHPRPRTGDRRHRRTGASRAVAREGVRGGRARRRALDLPLARRRRSHRCAVRRARALPARHAGDQLLRRRTPATREARAAAGAHALGRAGRQLRRRRSRAPAVSPAGLRRPDDARPVRSEDAERCGSSTRFACFTPGSLDARRPAPGVAGTGDAGTQQRDLALACLARPGRLSCAMSMRSRPWARTPSLRRTVRCCAAAGSTTHSTVCAPLPGRPPSRHRVRNCSTASWSRRWPRRPSRSP